MIPKQIYVNMKIRLLTAKCSNGCLTLRFMIYPGFKEAPPLHPIHLLYKRYCTGQRKGASSIAIIVMYMRTATK